MAQTSAGLTNGGNTAHYQISYDTSLSAADGLGRATALLAHCEDDFNLMAGWFFGVGFKFDLPISVAINNATGGASWQDPTDLQLKFGFNPAVSMNAGSGPTGGSSDFIRFLLVAEVTEMFMASQDGGWFESTSLFKSGNEGSKGEGLSRFLSYQFKVANGLEATPFAGTTVVPVWLNSIDRPNFVDNAPDDNTFDVVNACTTCFIFYLHYQLGFTIEAIVHAGSGTLAGVYTSLTGKTDGWDSFLSLVDQHYPRGFTYNPAGDKIFPVSNLSNLDDTQIQSGSAQSRPLLRLDNAALTEILIFLTSESPAAMSVFPGQVNVPVGADLIDIPLTAPLITGPAFTVAIHADYAGERVSSNIAVVPQPSTIAGRVTDAALNPIANASVDILSDDIILPGLGNTVSLETDGGGFYSSPAIPPRVYQLNAISGNFVPGHATVTVLEGAPVTTQNFALATALPFTIAGQVTGLNGAAVANATITLNGAGRITATTDGSGHYSLSQNPGPYDGLYTIAASADGFLSFGFNLTIPNGAVLTENFTLAALGSLAGFIRDASENAVTTATIAVGSLSAHSDPAGHYTLPGLPPGVNHVTLSAGGFNTVTIDINVVSGVVTPLDFVLVKSTAVITGLVTDVDTGDPLEHATVTGFGSTATGVDGRYTFTAVPAGPVEVTATALRHGSEKASVVAIDDQTVEVDFQLQRFSPGPNPRPN